MNPPRLFLNLCIATATLTMIGLTSEARAARTVGLMEITAEAFPGYTLFSTLNYPEIFLIDNYGDLVHSWPTTFVSGNTNYLLENGDLLRGVDPGGNTVFIAGGDAGLIQQRDWDGNIVMEFLYSNDEVRHHHDIAPMPNGNILVIAWEYRSEAEALQAGRDPAFLPNNELWPEHIIEIEPDGSGSANIVWEWHVWDHLIQDFDGTKDNFGVVGDHPELVDINYGAAAADWLHANAIDYNAELDQIVLSVPRFHEFWIIDHSTTTEEAAGHSGGSSGMGGDILYRWGNPLAYDRGTVDDQKFWGQHDVDWIPNGLPGGGNIMVFNNGNGRPDGNYSTQEEITTTVDGNGMYPVPAPGIPHGPTSQTWIHEELPHVYSSGLSSSQRVPNGNTLIAVGRGGEFFEINEDGNRVWTYINPVSPSGPITQGDPANGNDAFRAERYATDFAGFDGRDLTPLGPIEEYLPASVEAPEQIRATFALAHYPNPVVDRTDIVFRLPSTEDVSLEVVDVRGRSVARIFTGTLPAGSHSLAWEPHGLPAGLYTYILGVGSRQVAHKLLLVK